MTDEEEAIVDADDDEVGNQVGYSLILHKQHGMLSNLMKDTRYN